MRRTWTIIGVGDVPGSFTWYQSLLGLPATAPAHDDFGQILDSDGTVLLCLHEWGILTTNPDPPAPSLIAENVDYLNTATARGYSGA